MNATKQQRFVVLLGEFEEQAEMMDIESVRSRYSNVPTNNDNKDDDEFFLGGKLSQTGLFFDLTHDFKPPSIEEFLAVGLERYHLLVSSQQGYSPRPDVWVLARLSRTYPSLVRDMWLWLIAVSSIPQVANGDLAVLRTPTLDMKMKTDVLFVSRLDGKLYVSAVQNVTKTPNGELFSQIKHDRRPGIGEFLPAIPTVYMRSSIENSRGQLWGFKEEELNAMRAMPFMEESKKLSLCWFKKAGLSGHAVVAAIEEGLKEWDAISGVKHVSINDYLESV